MTTTQRTSFDDTPLDHTGLPASSKRIKVMADYSTYPLWAMDEGLMGDFAPQDLGVSDELSVDLWTWANEFDASLNPDDPANSRWSADRYKQHVAEGIALARRIKGELPDREVFVHDESGNLIEIERAPISKGCASLPLLPVLRGEKVGMRNGDLAQTFAYAAAPHPDPLPAEGRGEGKNFSGRRPRGKNANREAVPRPQ